MTVFLGSITNPRSAGQLFLKRRIYFEAQRNVCCDARYNTARKDDVKTLQGDRKNKRPMEILLLTIAFVRCRGYWPGMPTKFQPPLLGRPA